MKDPAASRLKPTMNRITIVQTLSYVFDWIILIVVGVIGLILGNVTPNKRPFSLQDPNISYVMSLSPHCLLAYLLACLPDSPLPCQPATNH